MRRGAGGCPGEAKFLGVLGGDCSRVLITDMMCRRKAARRMLEGAGIRVGLFVGVALSTYQFGVALNIISPGDHERVIVCYWLRKKVNCVISVIGLGLPPCVRDQHLLLVVMVVVVLMMVMVIAADIVMVFLMRVFTCTSNIGHGGIDAHLCHDCCLRTCGVDVSVRTAAALKHHEHKHRHVKKHQVLRICTVLEPKGLALYARFGTTGEMLMSVQGLNLFGFRMGVKSGWIWKRLPWPVEDFLVSGNVQGRNRQLRERNAIRVMAVWCLTDC